jgi:hypothetical protein
MCSCMPSAAVLFTYEQRRVALQMRTLIGERDDARGYVADLAQGIEDASLRDRYETMLAGWGMQRGTPASVMSANASKQSIDCAAAWLSHAPGCGAQLGGSCSCAFSVRVVEAAIAIDERIRIGVEAEIALRELDKQPGPRH